MRPDLGGKSSQQVHLRLSLEFSILALQPHNRCELVTVQWGWIQEHGWVAWPASRVPENVGLVMAPSPFTQAVLGAWPGELSSPQVCGAGAASRGSPAGSQEHGFLWKDLQDRGTLAGALRGHRQRSLHFPR